MAKLTQPLTSRLTSPLLRSVAAAPSEGVGVLGSFSPLKKAIVEEAGDAVLLVLGDSRGNATDETIYLFAVDLGLEHPTHTVEYYLVNQTTPTSYDAPVTIQTGSGARKIKVYNASYVGTVPAFFLGAKRAAIIDAISPALVLWNYGANLTNGNAYRGEYLMGLDPVRLAHPTAAHAAILPYSYRDDTTIDGRMPDFLALFADYGDMVQPDYFTAMNAAGKPSGYYDDNVHANATGNTFLRPILINAYRGARPSLLTPTPAGLATNGTNLLGDGHFDNLLDSGDAGSDWNLLASPTVAVESTIKPVDASRSLKFTGTTAGGRMEQFISAPNLAIAVAAGWVTLGVKMYVPAGSAGGVGRIGLSINNGVSVTQRSGALTGAEDGWLWSFLSCPVPSNSTGIKATLYCDTSANASSTVYYETAIITATELPRDMPEPETEALVARFSTPPSAARKTLINNLIKSLKADGVWSKLDAFYVMAAETEQAGQRNWIKDAHNLSPVNSPTFTADRGYDFNGTTQYLSTQYTPSTEAVQYALDSASLFSWSTENVQGDGYSIGSFNSGISAIIPRRSGVADTYLAAINAASTSGGAIGTVTDSRGLTHAERSTAALTTVYKNGVSAATNTVASSAVPAQPIFIGARDTDGSPTNYDTRAQAAAGIGASLGPTAAAALYTALNTYLVAVGAAP